MKKSDFPTFDDALAGLPSEVAEDMRGRMQTWWMMARFTIDGELPAESSVIITQDDADVAIEIAASAAHLKNLIERHHGGTALYWLGAFMWAHHGDDAMGGLISMLGSLIAAQPHVVSRGAGRPKGTGSRGNTKRYPAPKHGPLVRNLCSNVCRACCLHGFDSKVGYPLIFALLDELGLKHPKPGSRTSWWKRDRDKFTPR